MFPTTIQTYKRLQNLSKEAPTKLQEFKASVKTGSFFSWQKSSSPSSSAFAEKESAKQPSPTVSNTH